MWAIKNFVCGPSASVAIGRRPYPGAIKQNGNRPRGHVTYKPYNTYNTYKPYNTYSVVL